MSSLDYDGTPEQPQSPGWGKGPVIVLTAGLVLALAGDGYLLKRSNNADDQMARIQADRTPKSPPWVTRPRPCCNSGSKLWMKR